MSRKAGEIIREFRIGKKMTLTSVCKGVMSLSQLSKFERGESEIIFQKMEGLLHNLNITDEEFELSRNNYESNNLQGLLNKIRRYYSEHNIGRLHAIYINELFNFKETGDIAYKLNAICINCFLRDLNKEKFPIKSSERHLLSEYLFSIDQWTKYELLLFSNTLPILTIDTIFCLAKEMIKNASQYKMIESYNKIMLQTLLNVCILGIENSKYSDVIYFKKILNDMLLDETFLYEKSVLNFINGLFEYKTNNKINGMQQMEKSISIFHQLDSINLAINYSEYIQKLN